MPNPLLLDTAKRMAEDRLIASRSGLPCARCITHPQYLLRWQDNLIEGVSGADCEADLRGGDGSELKGRYSRRTGKEIPAKFCAPYSSAALTVNTFGPFRRLVPLPPVAGLTGFSMVRFEYRCSNGLRTRHGPNFDLLLQADDGGVVAVESKFLETLGRKRVEFKPQYDGPFRGSNGRHLEVEEPWRVAFEDLKSGRLQYTHLDAAQLVKHYLGLKVEYKDRSRILLYLFWEPTNAVEYDEFGAHRAEVADFAKRVGRCDTKFLWICYSDLWREWESTGTWAGMSAHISRLRARYGFSV